MRALVLTELNHLEVEEVSVPHPAPGEVLIRVAATGICGSDIHGYTGENGRRQPGQVMGHESAGHIAELGAGVAGFGLGDPVTFNPVVVPVEESERFRGREQHSPDKVVIGVAPERQAAFADYLVVPARNVVTLPPDLPIEFGALVEPLAVALHAVRRVSMPNDTRALVVGGGPIGQSVILALLMEGFTGVFASELDPSRRALCEQLGAVVLEPLAAPLSDQLLARGGLVDVSLDAVGVSSTLADALTATAFGGRVCLVGMGAKRLELDAFRVSTEERSIVGSFTYSAADFRDAAAHISRNPDRVAPLISREIDPVDADAAFSALAAGDGTPGKVLVRFDR